MRHLPMFFTYPVILGSPTIRTSLPITCGRGSEKVLAGAVPLQNAIKHMRQDLMASI